MKMVKKILLGLIAAAAVISFAGCKQVDDTKHAISGSGNDYSIDFENTESEKYRAYESTTLNRAGALVKVKFDKEDVGTSKMGVIFGLKDENGAKEFGIIGIGTLRDGPNFYVSKFSNVTDIQAENFGAPNGDAEETPIVALTSGNKYSVPTAAPDGSVTVYVYFKANINGTYDYALLNLTDAQASAIDMDSANPISNYIGNSVNYLAGGNTATAKFFEAVGNTNDIPQSQLAVYAMVAPGKTLKGSWKYVKFYKEAEELEE